MEIWKGVIYQGIDYSDRLEVSNEGRLRNAKTKRIYKLQISPQGYYQKSTSLGSKDKRKVFTVHRCVAETFLKNPNNYPIINHIDGNKLNNKVSNLEFCTYSYNTKHAIKMGLQKINTLKGTDNPGAKLTEDDVRFIRSHYIPRDRVYGTRGLGRMFDVDHETIRDVINKNTYTNVT